MNTTLTSLHLKASVIYSDTLDDVPHIRLLRRSSYCLSFRSRNVVFLGDYNATTIEQKTKKKNVYYF